MLDQYHETRLEQSMAAVFTALLSTLAVGRWDSELDNERTSYVPRRGCRYSFIRKGRLCRGQVLECLRPVSLVLRESLHRSPSRVDLRCKWRVEPVDDATLLKYEVKAVLNRAAGLHRRNWEQKLARDWARLVAFMHERLDATPNAQGTVVEGEMGQTTGSKSIVTEKMSTVSGKPILR
jgi:hypothetical protein